MLEAYEPERTFQHQPFLFCCNYKKGKQICHNRWDEHSLHSLKNHLRVKITTATRWQCTLAGRWSWENSCSGTRRLVNGMNTAMGTSKGVGTWDRSHHSLWWNLASKVRHQNKQWLFEVVHQINQTTGERMLKDIHCCKGCANTFTEPQPHTNHWYNLCKNHTCLYTLPEDRHQKDFCTAHCSSASPDSLWIVCRGWTIHAESSRKITWWATALTNSKEGHLGIRSGTLRCTFCWTKQGHEERI